MQLNKSIVRFFAPVLLVGTALVATPLAALAAPTPSPSPSPSPVGPWSTQPSGVETHLHGIFAFNGCNAWAVGEEADSLSATPSPTQATVVATIDGGKTWYPQSFPAGTAQNTTMNRVFFTDVTHGYAAGENSGTPQVFAARPAIVAVSPSPSPIPSPSPTPAPRKANLFRTSNGGNGPTGWEDISINLPSSAGGSGSVDIEGLTAVKDEVWISLDADGTGLILHSANRGTSWNTQLIDANSGIDSVSMFDSLHGFATSNDNKFWQTSNGGGLWTSTLNTAQSAEQVWAQGPTSAVIAENSSTIEYTTDGLMLHTANIPNTVNADLTDIAFGGSSLGFATGELNGDHLKSVDGGLNWSLESTNSGNNNYNGVTVAKGTGNAWVAGESGVIAGNTDPAVACQAVLPAATPGLPPAGEITPVERDLRIGLLLTVLLGIAVAGLALSQRVTRKN